MQSILIKNARIVNRGTITGGDILITNGRIAKIAGAINFHADVELDATGKHVLPGIIDDQVHFREPGLTHKADIFSESRAAVAGGVTSFMEMPNTRPPATSQALLAEKYAIASRTSLANYSFYMGAANDNLEEVLRTDPENVCGVKVFMGSSTGNMLVDDASTLEALFSRCPMLIATHCEDEPIVKANEARFREKFGEDVPMHLHPEIRSPEACLKSSALAFDLAKKHGARLHILHISTKDELDLFTSDTPLDRKMITAEVCVHHLFFDANDYAALGSLIKCNPAIKSPAHREALFPALLDGRLDVIATDHAPHTREEKQNTYFHAPSGLPLVQHSLNVMLEFYHQGRISLERIVDKMCHAPAIAFRVADRGFLDEGKWADLVIVDSEKNWTVHPENIRYKCGWSPFAGHTFKGSIETTIVNGSIAWHQGRLIEARPGMRLNFMSR